jgi:uncharacterized protein YpmS
MKNYARIISLICAVIILASYFTSCANSENDGNSTNDSSQIQDSVVTNEEDLNYDKDGYWKDDLPEELDYNELFDDLFARYTTRAVLVKVKLKNLGTLFQLTYDITLKNVKEEKQFIDELRVRNANLDILCSRVITGSDEL